MKIIEAMIIKMNDLNAVYVNQYNSMNGTIDMHLFSSYLTTIYSYLIKYPVLTVRILKQKEFLEEFIQFTDLINFFNYYSTHQSKVII